VDTLLAQIYPNRVLIGVVSVALLAALAFIGWRRGWHHTARRHPRSTAVAVAMVLAVGLPGAWYLGSPLFVRTDLVEPPPVVDAAPRPSTQQTPSPAAAGSAAATAPSTPAATATVALEALAGRFAGADNFHFARGLARLIETAPGRFTLRLENFSVRNGPDLYLYLSPDPRGYARDAVELGRLKATDGWFNYQVPPGVKVDRVRSVVIWCKAFSVQFGAAELRA
jgi:hypothetical protein